MRYVDKTAGQITCVGCLHSGIGQTLTGTVRRNKVFEHRHTFLEVRKDRVLDNLLTFGTCLLWLSHQTTHTGKLLNLVLRTTGTGVEHHIYSVETLIGLGHLLHQNVTKVIIDMGPSINYLIVALGICDETHFIVGFNLINFGLALANNLSFLLRDNNIIEVERKTCNIGHTITQVLDTVKE